MAKHGHQEASHHLPSDLSLALLALGTGGLVLAGVVQAEPPSDSIMDFRKPCEDRGERGGKSQTKRPGRSRVDESQRLSRANGWII